MSKTSDLGTLFDQKRAATFLQARGHKIAAATLQKLRCVGGGPKWRCVFGNRVIYSEADLVEWADRHTSPPIESTSGLPPRPIKAA